MDLNQALIERAQHVIPGGVNSPVRAFGSVGGAPRFIERAKGPYMWDVTDNVTADVYAKYFWGHLWGDDGTICGQKFEFDDIYSSRVRTGARLNFKKDETFSWYLGGAWEHQFDSKSRGTIYGYAFDRFEG